MASNRTTRHANLLDSAKLATDIPSKLDYLRQLKQDLVHEDPALLSEFLPRLFELQSDSFSPVRKFAAEYAFFFLSLLFFFGGIYLFVFRESYKISKSLNVFLISCGLFPI